MTDVLDQAETRTEQRFRRIALMVSTSVWTWVRAAELEIVEGHVLLALAGTDHPIDALEIGARSRLSLDAVYPAVNRLTGRGYTLEEHRLHGLTDSGRRLVAEFDRSHDLVRVESALHRAEEPS